MKNKGKRQKKISEKEIIENFERITKMQGKLKEFQENSRYLHKKYLKLHENNALIFKNIIKIFKQLESTIRIIIFIICITSFSVFLQKPTKFLLNEITSKYSALPESYKILILGLIFSLLSAIVAQIIVHFLIEKIKKIIKK